MKINKRLANRLRKHNLAFIGRNLVKGKTELTRAAVSVMLSRLIIPDKHVERFAELTGETIE